MEVSFHKPVPWCHKGLGTTAPKTLVKAFDRWARNLPYKYNNTFQNPYLEILCLHLRSVAELGSRTLCYIFLCILSYWVFLWSLTLLICPLCSPSGSPEIGLKSYEKPNIQLHLSGYPKKQILAFFLIGHILLLFFFFPKFFFFKESFSS